MQCNNTFYGAALALSYTWRPKNCRMSICLNPFYTFGWLYLGHMTKGKLLRFQETSHNLFLLSSFGLLYAVRCIIKITGILHVNTSSVPTSFTILPVLKLELPISQLHRKPCCCKMGSPFHNHLIQHSIGMIRC